MPVGALVPDIAGLGVAGGGLATDLSAGGGVAITALATLLLGWAGAGRSGGGGEIARVSHRTATEARGGLVEHAIGADQGLLPGLGTDEACLMDEGDGLDQQLVEALSSDRLTIQQDGFLGRGMLAQSSQEMAQATFGRVLVVVESEKPSIVGVAGIPQGTQDLRAMPSLDGLPADEQEEGEGVEGRLAPC